MNNVNNREEELTVRELIKPYQKKWYWFIISALVMLFLAFLYIKISTPIYKIKTSVLIKDAKKMSSASGDFGVLAGLGGFAGMGTNSIENEVEIFKSRNIVENVVKNLKLQTSIFSREKFYDVELYKDTNPFFVHVINEKHYEELPKEPIDIEIKGDKITLSSKELKNKIVTTFNQTISLPYANLMITKNPNFNAKKVKKMDLNDLYFIYTENEVATNVIQKSVDVDLLDKDATIIGMTMPYANKDKAIDILDDIVKVYNEYAIIDKNTESKKTKDFIDDRIVIISKELGEVETEKQRFKIDNDVVDLGTETRINLQISTEAQKKALELDTQIELTNILLNYINSPKNSYQVLPTNIGMDGSSSAAVGSNLSLYNAAIIERNRLLENATIENPLVVENSKKIDALRQSLKESLLKSKSGFELTRNSILSQKGASDFKIGKVPLQEKVFRGIERQQQIKESLYLLLLQKREEAAIAMAITSNKARVVDTAYAEAKPIAPKKMILLVGGLFAGLILPFAFIYLRELLNNKLISKHDLEKISDTTVLAEIPRVLGKEDELIQLNDVSPLAESFRILMTNLNFMLPKRVEAKKIFVTSTVKGEGKTFVSVNLALAYASSNKKVLVIGSDIRNPQLQRYNPGMKRTAGLTEFLYGSIDDIKTIIHPSGFNENCDFIYSGVIPPNPTELLQNGRYQILIDGLINIYDYIILDTAPLMLVTDSFLISEIADVTLYVTRSEVTEKDFIAFANNNIKAGKIKNVGFVLNDVHKSNFGYGNKYGYGYHAEEKSWWQKLFG